MLGAGEEVCRGCRQTSGAVLTRFMHDHVVMLNVGGKLITTLASTLRAHPSRLVEWLDDGFKELPRDADNHPFIDRDYESFKYVLNFLRGYGLPVHPDELLLLADDALYYNVAALKAAIGMESPPVWRFNPGPGIDENRSTFAVTDILNFCGSEAFSTRNTYMIAFRIDKCELIELGVLGIDGARRDRQIHRQRNSVCYCNTGELIKYISDEPIYTHVKPYKASDSVTISVCYKPGTPPQPSPKESANEALAALSTQDMSGVTLPEFEAPQPPLAPTTPRDAELALGEAVSATFVRASDMHEDSQAPRLDTWDVDSMNAANPDMYAQIRFISDAKILFEVIWPAPVPPLQFAVSMQGTSSVTILRSLIEPSYLLRASSV